jgi:hypothetical protein
VTGTSGSKNAAAGSSEDAATSPTPLGTSQSLKRTANAAQLDEASAVGAASESGSLSKKKKL